MNKKEKERIISFIALALADSNEFEAKLRKDTPIGQLPENGWSMSVDKTFILLSKRSSGQTTEVYEIKIKEKW